MTSLCGKGMGPNKCDLVLKGVSSELRGNIKLKVYMFFAVTRYLSMFRKKTDEEKKDRGSGLGLGLGGRGGAGIIIGV